MTREEAIKIMKNYSEWYHFRESEEKAFRMGLKALEQEPCEDAISRAAAVEMFQMFRDYESNRSNKEWVDRIKVVLKKLPPVNPQPKTGHWIYKMLKGQFCSICDEPSVWKFNYCPNCGAEMVERQESEDGEP